MCTCMEMELNGVVNSNVMVYIILDFLSLTDTCDMWIDFENVTNKTNRQTRLK